MFNYMCMFLSLREGGLGYLVDIFEEFKLNVVKCFFCFFQSLLFVVRGVFYLLCLFLVFGYLVSVLLVLLGNEKVRNLRVCVFECFSYLVCCSENFGWQLEVGSDFQQ